MANDIPARHRYSSFNVERRVNYDRRSGSERRGSEHHSQSTVDSRPYGFREFNDRRQHSERRESAEHDLAWADCGSTWPAPVWSDRDAHDGGWLIDVTPPPVGRRHNQR